MHQKLEAIGQDSLLFGTRDATQATAVTASDTEAARANEGSHLHMISSAFFRSGMNLDVDRVALVVIDPQIDFLTPGRGSAALHQDGAELRTIQNLARLLKASKRAGIPVAISLTSPRGLRSEFIPDLTNYIEDRDTIICSPHLVYRQLRVNDVGLRLREQRIHQIILAGMIASLRIEAHLRDFIEQGFEVAVVGDAIAGARLPEGSGYLSALVNFRCIVNSLWTTDETIRRLG
jgi:nicotinamidase-related amidase